MSFDKISGYFKQKKIQIFLYNSETEGLLNKRNKSQEFCHLNTGVQAGPHQHESYGGGCYFLQKGSLKYTGVIKLLKKKK